MESRTFKQAFDSVFHSEEKFQYFQSFNIEDEVKEFTANSRELIKTTSSFKKYLRFIDRVVFRQLKKNEEVVHSYIKGKSALTAVQEHVSSRFFFMTDIKDFFSCITTPDVEKMLLSNKDLMPISDIESYIPKISEIVTWKGVVPVGYATSPSISNAFLLGFDNSFDEYCRGIGAVYTRYSDDIIVSSSYEDALADLEEVVTGFLGDVSDGLEINQDKTKRTHIGNKVKILGLVITPDGRVTINSKYKKLLESAIYFYMNDRGRYEHLLEGGFKNGEHSLFGMLNYAKSIDPKYLKKLQRKYGVYVLSRLMEDRWSD